jgi:pyruvate dehydrogenase kinase 2/3/4
MSSSLYRTRAVVASQSTPYYRRSMLRTPASVLNTLYHCRTHPVNICSSRDAKLLQCNLSKMISTCTTRLSAMRFSTVAASIDERDPDKKSQAEISKFQLPDVDTIDVLLQQSGISREYIEKLGKQHPTPLRLKDMYEYGCTNDQKIQRLRNAQFLHRELPVRIAHRAIDLLTLPHGLSNAIPIQQVATIYLTLLRRISEFPLPTNIEQEERFTDMLQSILLDRTSIPTSIAQGIQAWLQKTGDEKIAATSTPKKTAIEQYQYEDRLREMDQALARFFTARVGLRFLVEQYVLTSPRESAQSFRHHSGMLPVLLANSNRASNESQTQKHLGCIQPNVDVAQEVRRMADIVAQQTKEYYNGLCPEIHIVDCASDYDEFTFVPHHLQYMVCELLKNSCRASVRKYKEREAATVFGDATTSTSSSKITIPSIRVIIVKGSEDVTIKVADQGGGIPRSRMATIWRFAHSTASMDEQDTTFGVERSSGARLRGFGLPLAEIYARYFGGELTLKSTEGYGLDAYLHLPRLGDACENLPLRVRDSPAGGVSLPTNTDASLHRATSMAASRPRTMGTRSVRSASRTYTAPMNHSTLSETVGKEKPSVPLGALDLASKMHQDGSTTKI